MGQPPTTVDSIIRLINKIEDNDTDFVKKTNGWVNCKIVLKGTFGVDSEFTVGGEVGADIPAQVPLDAKVDSGYARSRESEIYLEIEHTHEVGDIGGW